MPKYNPQEADLYVEKNCAYCGNVFYPLADEDFCDYNCEMFLRLHYEDMDFFWLVDFLKEEANNDIQLR